MRQQKRPIGISRFSGKWQIGENGELGKNPTKILQNLKLGDKEGNLDKRRL